MTLVSRFSFDNIAWMLSPSYPPGQYNQVLKNIVGSRYGDNPFEHLNTIRSDKHHKTFPIAESLNLSSDDCLLEIGMGCGWSAQVFAPMVNTYFGTDFWSDALLIAKQELKDLPNVTLSKMDYGNLTPFENSGITKVCAISVFTQFDFYDFVIYLKEIHRILSPGGLFYFDFMNADHLNICSNEALLRHTDFYLQTPDLHPHLLKWISGKTLERFVTDIGFAIIHQNKHSMTLKK